MLYPTLSMGLLACFLYLGKKEPSSLRVCLITMPTSSIHPRYFSRGSLILVWAINCTDIIRRWRDNHIDRFIFDVFLQSCYAVIQIKGRVQLPFCRTLGNVLILQARRRADSPALIFSFLFFWAINASCKSIFYSSKDRLCSIGIMCWLIWYRWERYVRLVESIVMRLVVICQSIFYF